MISIEINNVFSPPVLSGGVSIFFQCFFKCFFLCFSNVFPMFFFNVFNVFSPPVLSGGVVVRLLAGTMGARGTVGEGKVVAEVPPASHGGHQAGDC